MFVGNIRSCSGRPITAESYGSSADIKTSETVLHYQSKQDLKFHIYILLTAVILKIAERTIKKWNKYLWNKRKGYRFSNKKTTTLVNLISILDNTLNSNTTFNSLDRVTAAFNTVNNSYGFIALAAVVNVIGNSAVVFDAIGNALERTRERIIAAIDRSSKQPGPEEFQDALELFTRNLGKQLTSINSHFSCGFPLMDSEDQTSCFPLITTEDEDLSNEDEDY